MYTFADLMRQAQGGQAIENFATAFGLGRTDVEKLMNAALPIFALGMKKSAQEMASPAAMAEMLDPQKFRAAYEDAQAAVSPAMTEAGRLAMEKMFGTGAAADVIAAQTAAVSGLGIDVVSRILPAMAATLFGGLAKEMEKTPLGPFFKAAGASNPAAAFGAMGNPMKDAMGAFLRGYAEGKPGVTEPPASGVQWPAGMEGFGKLFEAGVEMTESNRKAFEQMFDPKRK